MSRARSAFTLLEILVSLALVGMIFLAMNTFIFSMGELWGKNTDVRLFDQHVNAVTRFLGQTLATATYPPSARASSAPVYPEQITPATGGADNLITFDLPAGLRLLNWPDRPLPEVTCSLQVRPNDGLYLLWHSRLEMHYADEPPREVKLTPFCTALGYDYYDDNFKKWTTDTALQNDNTGQPTPPQRLRLYFQYGKLKRETIVPIPAAVQGTPVYP